MRRVDEDYQAAWIDEEDIDEEEEISDSDDDTMVTNSHYCYCNIFPSYRCLLLTWTVKVLL